MADKEEKPIDEDLHDEASGEEDIPDPTEEQDGEEEAYDEYSDNLEEEDEPTLKDDGEDEEPCDFEVYADFTEMGSGSFNVSNSNQTTTCHLTKYERARILGLRAEQLSCGAPPLVPYENETDTYEIALKELRSGVLPFIIGRPLPNGEKIVIPVSNLIV